MSRKWTYEIGCGYESILRDGVMVNKEQAVRALKNYESRITELEAEVTKCHELQDSYCDRIAELEAAQRWIPVEERLPELYEKVIVLVEGGYMKVDFLCHMRGDFMYSDMKVTHWMPLPTPPEDK